MAQKKRTWEITAEKPQMAYLKSLARYPLFAASWGTGKTLFSILKCLKLCRQYPGNLGLIARKEYTDLRDSTIQDFQKYTGLRIKEQHKEIEIPDTGGSKIIFRHADEFNTLQNINLGFFFLEQVDEIEDENIFDFLRGRLRRGEYQQGMMSANATDTNHWVYRRYKEPASIDADYALFEMTTAQNSKNLPDGFLNDLMKLQKDNPPMFDRYVANIWGITDDKFILIPSAIIDSLKGVHILHPERRRIIAIDPSGGGDECPLMYMVNGEVKDTLILHETDTMKIVGHALIFGGPEKHNCNNYAVDIIGLGRGVGDRLTELGKKVIRIESSGKPDSSQYFNRRAEMYGYTANLIRERKIPYIADPETRKQLATLRYDAKAISSNGELKLEAKEQVKKRLGNSPDRADCYVYGQWALQYVAPDKRKGSIYDDERIAVASSAWAA